MVPTPFEFPPGAQTSRGPLLIFVQIQLGVVAIVPPVTPAVSAGIHGSHVTGALVPNAPSAQSQLTGSDRVVPLTEFGGIGVDLEGDNREILAIGGVLRPLFSDGNNRTRPLEQFKCVGGSLRAFVNGSTPFWGNQVGGRAPRGPSTFSNVRYWWGRIISRRTYRFRRCDALSIGCRPK